MLLLLGCFIDTVNRIQASWISDVRQALGYDLDEEIFVISHIHISFGMAGKLRLASALSGEETESDHFALSSVQTRAGIIVTEAVCGQTAGDMPGFPRLFHLLSEDVSLRLDSFFEAVLHGGCCLAFQRKFYPAG